MFFTFRTTSIAVLIGFATYATSGVYCYQPPKSGGGNLRSSQLWVDPSGQGNDLDGDAIIYADFVLSQASSINHVEWWGTGACEIGFQLEFWKQDPGTIAYQPYGVFRGSGAKPEKAYGLVIPTISGDPSGMIHYSAELPTSTNLAANDATNPRWFFSVIGLTSQAYYPWNWSQNSAGSTRSFQWIRGGHEGGGDLYRSLPEGRAMVLSQLGKVQGTLNFGSGYVGTYAPPGNFTIELRSGGTVIESTVATVGNDGKYSVVTSQQGTFDIALKGSHWLTRIKPGVVLGPTGASGVNASLINGDVDGDDVVSVFDYIGLSDAFDADPFAWNWLDGADLDNDGVVSIFDYIILSDNFDVTGDI